MAKHAVVARARAEEGLGVVSAGVLLAMAEERGMKVFNGKSRQ